MISIALLSRPGLMDPMKALLARELPGVTVSSWPEPATREAELAVCWKPEPGALAAMPKLKLIHSIAAGVDNILSDPTLPDVPLCRIVDPDITSAMTEFVLWATLYFHRDFDRVISNARDGLWRRYDQYAAKDRRVGILGLGALGTDAALRLVDLGFAVSAWSRSPKQLAGVTTFSGADALDAFLSETDILVSLLPLTPSTVGLLDAARLSRLPKGAALILCSRGEHVVTDDLVGLLRSGHLRGAVLDVFEQEPLPSDHPLWREPGVLVTPHMAAIASWETITLQVADNARRLLRGEPLLNTVDRARGY
ncbi:glyoxylate/hydroxypyruvate reductase A [Bradyrhizobium sp. SSBR45G]|uniref:2-hydroxyacid dehydrogenase n=1 Tax=unclassified Bradyrhizobium TaxID=2631580 RepID=UPI00234298F2|nr:MULTISPECIES: glyoxylate/hydroxypyruvate reductase A [unclassified Bradyrhizobium]GLH75153.1 glyoxylate/hydroxypyruvate reductase A [Bradyrhizobium sp. SSBR45G]GLH83060.1 glyoxylate/hydroxypyruvate reductase A [Bradyrhizobium sp. SSBR45R]